jgi:para-nitrobenzyl esterase
VGPTTREQPLQPVNSRPIVRLSLLVLVTLAGAAGCGGKPPPGPPTVTVNHETLVGLYEEPSGQVASFRGIPFAAPPIGTLRWAPPMPPVARSGPQPAQAFAPACYQDSGNRDWYRSVAKPFGAAAAEFQDPPISEDCLYLNVWTPTPKPGAALPVLVWIHGGGNENGYSYEPNYLGGRLALRGHAVVVSVAYRVNVFGFFSHPELTHAAAPANFGLLDQIAALRWVRDNIAQFGGDPANVTVFGESAGGLDIGYLLNAPPARGLFRRAVSQSGGYLLLEAGTLKEAESAGRRLASAFPENPDLAGLRSKSAAAVLAVAKRALTRHEYQPVTDGIVVTTPPAAAIRETGIALDLLVGSNQNEDFMYIDGDAGALQKEIAELPPKARVALGDAIRSAPDARLARDRLWTLVNMRCPAYLMARSAAEHGHRSWVYLFTRVRPSPGGAALLAYHGAEIPYVFDTHDAWLPTEPADRTLTDVMLAYWTNFARSGDPNGPGLPPWPAYGAGTPQVMELGDVPGAISAPDHRLCGEVADALYPAGPGSPTR